MDKVTCDLTNNMLNLDCGICGDNHRAKECTFIQFSSYVPDEKHLSKARLTLPKTLKVETMADGAIFIISKNFIKAGTMFGPFIAPRTRELRPDVMFVLKIFSNGSECYLDTTSEHECNWLHFVQAASTLNEQNLICYQVDEDIYYSSSRDIHLGEALKVWYSSHYSKKMGKPLLEPEQQVEDNTLQNVDLSQLLTKQQKIPERENWVCKFCSLIEKDVIKFSNHILGHYRLQLRKICEICKKGFWTRLALKKHVEIVHVTKSYEIPKVEIAENFKENSINEVHEPIIGGPLLNTAFTDSLDTPGLVIQPTDISGFQVNENNLLIEPDNLNIDNLLNENVKELDDFNFEITESHEQFVCDVCLKGFSKLQHLVMHLKKHTAMYTCSKCLKIFGRSENLKSHPCNLVPRELKCHLCGKVFPLPKYLKRHISAAHSSRFKCQKCGKIYHSATELKQHNCPKIPSNEKITYPCPVCQKVFLRESYMKLHRKTHDPPSQKFVCEVCACRFSSRNGLLHHRMNHNEAQFACQICDKKYKRKLLLTQHLMTHGPAQFKCDVCGKEFKVKKYLVRHKALHKGGERVYRCLQCSKTFADRSNLVRHQNVMHSCECPVCKEKFKNLFQRNQHAIRHLNEYYACGFCDGVFKLRSSLVRHLKHKHPGEALNLDAIKPVVKEGSDQQVVDFDGHDLDAEDFANIDFEQGLTGNIAEDEGKSVEGVIDFNDFEMELTASFDLPQDISNQEVCLSMPDLESEQEITFGQNAYMMENGNVIEPQGDNGKFVVYVLDQKFQTH